VRGLPEGAYGLNYSTRAGRYNVDQPDVTVQRGEPTRVRIPQNGAITLFSRQLAAPEGSD
jgi:hypothetical protein